MQSQAETRGGEPDRDLRKSIEREFGDWGKKKNASVDWMDSWTAIQKLAVRTVALSGEALILRTVDRQSKWGVRLQLLEPDFLPLDMNETAKNGREIRMGIEIDSSGRPLAYNLATDHPGDSIFSTVTGRYKRIPAENVIHLFIRERPGQLRGIPWMASAIIDAHHLDKFLEATLVKQRVESSKMGFLEKEDGGEVYKGQDEDEDGAIISEVQAGLIEELPAGMKFSQFDPTSTENLEIFVKTILRRLAVGMGVAYHSLSGDLEKVSYSSVRAGVLENQDQYKTLQGWAIENLCDPVWDWWMELALLNGRFQGVGVGDIERAERVKWQGRRWAWVDPKKELEAKKIAIGLGIESRPGVIIETGRDPDQVTEEIENDEFIPPAVEAEQESAPEADETETEGDQSDGSESENAA
jgi:lambda family phage portal protein